jgi:hypothetical protein
MRLTPGTDLWHDSVLSTRAIGVLVNAEIETKAQAKEAILSGKLNNRRGCGKLTFNEISEWAGLPKPFDRCPTCGGPLTRKRFLALP